MSTAIPTSGLELSSTSSSRNRWPLREPLVHFVALGAVLFAADYLLLTREDDPRTIVVDAAVDREAVAVFKDARGREPNEEELYALRRVWLDNEVLYREGLALGLDKGDKSIRERVIFKALSVVDAGIKLPPVDEPTLRAWFERNRSKYDEPARFDFQEAVLAGDTSETNLRAFASALNAGTPGDAQAGLRVFEGRPHANIVQSYGDNFAGALEKLPRDEWTVLSSSSGARVVKLVGVSPAKPAVFDELQAAVLQDWTDATMAEKRSAAVSTLAKKYTVQVVGEGQ